MCYSIHNSPAFTRKISSCLSHFKNILARWSDKRNHHRTQDAFLSIFTQRQHQSIPLLRNAKLIPAIESGDSRLKS